MMIFIWLQRVCYLVRRPLVFGRPKYRTSELCRTSDKLLSCCCVCAILCGPLDVRTSSDVRQLETSDVRNLSDVGHFLTYCSNGHVWAWAINTPSHPLVRVDHFI